MSSFLLHIVVLDSNIERLLFLRDIISQNALTMKRRSGIMSQNPNPYESTSYGSNPQGGNNPNYNSPYEQYEPTLPSSGNNPGGYEPTQRAPSNNPNANAYPPPPYGQPPAGMGSNPSYPQYGPPQQNNPYQYPNQNPGTPP